VIWFGFGSGCGRRSGDGSIRGRRGRPTEVQNGGKSHRRVVKRYQPDTEDLEDCDVKYEVLLIESNTLHRAIDPRTHDLVPPICPLNQPSRVWPAPCTAKRVGEGGIWRKVFLNRCMLQRWRRLREEVNYCGDFLDWIFHLGRR